MDTLLNLLGAFAPSEWNEETFIKKPPFSLEGSGGKAFATPTDPSTEVTLDRLSKTMGLKKRKQGSVHYLITKGSSLKAFRQFGWFVRRSWRNEEFAVLWAVIHFGQTKGWTEFPVSLDEIAELAGCSRKRCAEILDKRMAVVGGPRLAGQSSGSNNNAALGGYQIDKHGAELVLGKMISELPNWTEELIMQTMCSGIGGSASEVYERLLAQGLGISSIYKTLGKLKQEDYIYPLRHYRVNEKGPMRELLAANCRSCFYGYSSPERCLADTLRQLEDILETYYGKRLTDQEREKLHSSIRDVPYSSRLSRKVYELLKLMQQIERGADEGGVPTVLTKIEESYGVELSLRRPQTAS
jgi:hypothetical protein